MPIHEVLHSRCSLRFKNFPSREMRNLKILFCLVWVPTALSRKVEAELDDLTGELVFNDVRYYPYVESMAGSVSPWNRQADTYTFHVVCTIICILFAALAAGLTMGLVSLEPFDMKILIEANEADCLSDVERDELRKEKEYAQQLYPLISRHHLLLVTLLLMNSIANEALPLFLNQIVPPVVAVIISVTAVLIFGEILPSAIFTGPNQLAIGAAMSPLVWLFIYIFWVIAYPISLILDRMLGEEHKGRYNKAEFRALINLHNEATDEESMEAGVGARITSEGYTDAEESMSGGTIGGLAGLRAELGAKQILNRSGVAKQELRIMTGALELHRLRVKDVMLPLDEVFMLSSDTKLDAETLATIVLKGHSRIPVYEGHPHNIRGMLLVKRLVVLNPEDKREVGSLALLEPLVVGTEVTLLDLLYQFSSGRSHLAIITSDPNRVLEALRSNTVIPVNVHMAGIVTLEDVIERLIKHDIQDESDMSVRSADHRMRAGTLEYNPSDASGAEEAVRLTSPLIYATNRLNVRAIADELRSPSNFDGVTPRLSPANISNVVESRASSRTHNSTPKSTLTVPLLARTHSKGHM
jgi:metal transporter CNNM